MNDIDTEITTILNRLLAGSLGKTEAVTQLRDLTQIHVFTADAVEFILGPGEPTQLLHTETKLRNEHRNDHRFEQTARREALKLGLVAIREPKEIKV